jgi:hypothetical protein
VHFRLRLIDTDGRLLGAAIPTLLADGDVAGRLRERGELYESAPGSGNAYRVSALRRLMPLPTDAIDRHGADFFTTYGISLLGRIRAVGAPMGSYRVHRTPEAQGLRMGNASRDDTEPHITYRRYERLQMWLIERLGPTHAPPLPAPNFSVEKIGYVRTIFSTPSYFRSLQAGSSLFVSNLLPAVGRVPVSRARRFGLAAWALAVLLLPRRAGLPLARFVVNPASR